MSKTRNRTSKAQPPKVAPTPAPPLSVDEARDLAGDLLRELTPHAGNSDEVRAVLLRWLDAEDVPRLSLVCIAAVFAIFADCLTPVPATEAAPGDLALTLPDERTAA